MTTDPRDLDAQGWTAYPRDHFGAFEALTAPLYWKTVGLSADEPLRIAFRVAAQHCNAGNVCHGGMLATFMDMALGLAVRAATKLESTAPTMTMTLDFVSPAAAGDWIESRVRLIHTTYKTAYCDGLAMGPKGIVARANGIFRLHRRK